MAFKTKALLAFTIFSVVFYLSTGNPVYQNPDYHLFADTLTILNIPNFFNVASNIIYLIVGVMGMQYLHHNWNNKNQFIEPLEVIPLYVVFLGALMLAFGSAFYHLKPDNITLMADRFTMTIGFMATLSFIISERISLKWGIRLLPVLLVLGLASIIYWIAPELYNISGNLKPYILVQGLSLFLILIIYFIYPNKYTNGKYILYALGLYFIAKVLESYDAEIYNFLGDTLSGHTLKHLASGLGIYYILRYIQLREIKP